MHYTTSCKTQSSAPEDGRNPRPKHVELIGIINKPLLLHLVGCQCYLYQWCTVKHISNVFRFWTCQQTAGVDAGAQNSWHFNLPTKLNQATILTKYSKRRHLSCSFKSQPGNSFSKGDLISHRGKFWDYRRIYYDVVHFGKWVPTFRKRVPLPSKEQMVEISFSEMFVLCYQTTLRHFPGDHKFSIL